MFDKYFGNREKLKNRIASTASVIVVFAFATGLITTTFYFSAKGRAEGIASIEPYFGENAADVYAQTEKGKQIMYAKFFSMANEAKAIRRNIEYDRGGTRISSAEFNGYYGANRFSQIVEDYNQMSSDVFSAPVHRLSSDHTIKTPITCLDIDLCS